MLRVLPLVLLTTVPAFSADLKELAARRQQIESRIERAAADGDSDELRTAVEESFDVAAQIHEARITKIEQQLAKLRDDYRRNLDGRDRWIDRRVERLTAGTASPSAPATPPAPKGRVPNVPVELIAREGWDAWRKQDWRTALEKFNQAIAIKPEDASILNGLGWTQFNIGQHAEALATFEKGLALAPGHGGLKNGRGQALLTLGQTEEAIKVLEETTQELIDQHGAGAVVRNGLTASWQTLIRTALDTGDKATAEQWAERYLKHKPNDTQVKTLLEAARRN